MILTRRYKFSASHRLHAPSLTNAENEQMFGKCNNPFGHGHNYVLEISVRGPVESHTGRVVNIGDLDGYVQQQVLAPLDHKDMNQDVPAFSGLVPTTENLAVVIDQWLRVGWASSFPNAELSQVRLQETERNYFELRGK